MVMSVVVARRIAVSSLRHHQFKLPYVRILGLVGLNLQYTSNGKFPPVIVEDLPSVAEHPSPLPPLLSIHLNTSSTINFHRLT